MQKKSIQFIYRQRGVALFVVIIFVMLSMLLALWASRTAWFNEMVVGNDADYQRAFEAAQALIQDAELDIRREQASGAACISDDKDPKICRKGENIKKFPIEDQDIGILLAELDSLEGVKCHDAICAKFTAQQDFWNNSDPKKGITLAQMQGVGSDKAPAARYGDYTGAKTGATSNPILAERTLGRGGWYWIEVLPYAKGAGNSALISNSATNLLDISLDAYVVYRITALAQGLKPNTQVVLQQTYARQRQKD
ncbi:PilX N-terminal domain-containing pilus assembly protein [Comamonas sp. NoAH]|uniref:pilus assembly PilX family protein n=1 Tax=Comamonas halotolerans TaxID=3041496 RepID=UPI0024E153C8|nr:PilX N-terminal domain-containing pilus assembly protein [Comamonas sp. NoAH]